MHRVICEASSWPARRATSFRMNPCAPSLERKDPLRHSVARRGRATLYLPVRPVPRSCRGDGSSSVRWYVCFDCGRRRPAGIGKEKTSSNRDDSDSAPLCLRNNSSVRQGDVNPGGEVSTEYGHRSSRQESAFRRSRKTGLPDRSFGFRIVRAAPESHNVAPVAGRGNSGRSSPKRPGQAGAGDV